MRSAFETHNGFAAVVVRIEPPLKRPVADALSGAVKVRSEVRDRFCPASAACVAECHHRDSIALSKFVQYRFRRFRYAFEDGAHFGACIEKQNYIERRFLVGEVGNALQLAVIGDAKVILFEACDAAVAVTHFDVDVYQRDIAAEGRLILGKQEEKEEAPHAC